MSQQPFIGPLMLILLGAIPLIAFGYAIAVKKKYHLIVGWKEGDKPKHPELPNTIGRSLIYAGLAVLFAAVGSYLDFISDAWLVAVCVAAGLYVVLRSVYAGVRFSKKSS
ncbi:hypothetical protein [Microbulbifer agarilyticus]|uniref:hypothetical protein n=1 Tax=Microbulbifer agarilyticus TaxID=260552 RepID=UPI001CD2E311|nr:hypothetical protein [Microbulbifer agarilyticus]MCA0901929.1 hypothetical protein [Microbulbifer agarilyticus]